MKKTLLLSIAMIIGSVSFAQNGTITNGDFENWSTMTLYENTDVWNTGNRYDETGPLLSTLKSTDAQNGSFSARMESSIVGQDTTFGFVLLGDIGDFGPSAGYPYTTTADTIKGWYKYDIIPGDSATIIVSFFSGGVPTMDLVTFTGTQNSWTEFVYPINSGLVVPDSVAIGFASSNAFANFALDGSWLMIDNISFASSIGSTDPIPNGDFENWVDVDTEDPDSWTTYNAQLAQTGFATTTKTTDANSGNFAVQMETIGLGNEFGGEPVPGIITNGNLGQQGPTGGVPYVAQPTMFSGFYKYTATPGDTGRVAVTFWDNGIPSAFVYREFHQTVATYTQFTDAVTVPTVPDSMNIFFWSGDSAGSTLILDDIQFSGGNVGVYEFDGNLDKFNVYPNPASDVVTLEFELSQVSDLSLNVYDASGRLVLKEAFGSQASGESRRTLDISSLQAGIYTYQLIADKKAVTKKLIVR
jgi:hypothetical protein